MEGEWTNTMLKPQLEMRLLKFYCYFFKIKISFSYFKMQRGDVKMFRGRVNVLRGVQN
jgi:hypothetical protein